jgi:hypothetical protein
MFGKLFLMCRRACNTFFYKETNSIDEFIRGSRLLGPDRIIEIKLKRTSLGRYEQDSIFFQSSFSYQHYFIARTTTPEKSRKDVVWMECIGEHFSVPGDNKKETETKTKKLEIEIRDLLNKLKGHFPNNNISLLCQEDILLARQN